MVIVIVIAIVVVIIVIVVIVDVIMVNIDSCVMLLAFDMRLEMFAQTCFRSISCGARNCRWMPEKCELDFKNKNDLEANERTD